MSALLESAKVWNGSGSTPTDSQFRKVLLGWRKAVAELQGRWEAGDLTPQEFADRLFGLLVDAHTDAWVMGRQRGGILAARHDTDLLNGRSRAALELDYLAGLVGRLSDRTGRYFDSDGNVMSGRLAADLDLYVRKIRGTATEAFVDVGDGEDEYDWILGITEFHCDDCPAIAAASPYRRDELYTMPGQGDTQCITNCLCHLVRHSDGAQSFLPVR